jgi:hypothetical protein
MTTPREKAETLLKDRALALEWVEHRMEQEARLEGARKATLLTDKLKACGYHVTQIGQDPAVGVPRDFHDGRRMGCSRDGGPVSDAALDLVKRLREAAEDLESLVYQVIDT